MFSIYDIGDENTLRKPRATILLYLDLVQNDKATSSWFIYFLKNTRISYTFGCWGKCKYLRNLKKLLLFCSSYQWRYKSHMSPLYEEEVRNHFNFDNFVIIMKRHYNIKICVLHKDFHTFNSNTAMEYFSHSGII